MTEGKQNAVTSFQARNNVSLNEATNANSFHHERQTTNVYFRGTPSKRPTWGGPWYQRQQGYPRQVQQSTHYHQSRINEPSQASSVVYHHGRGTENIFQQNHRSSVAGHQQEILRTQGANMEDSSNRSGGWFEDEDFVGPPGYGNEQKCMHGANRIVQKYGYEKTDQDYGPPFEENNFTGNAHFDATCHEPEEHKQNYSDYSYGPLYGDLSITDDDLNHFHQSRVQDTYSEHSNGSGFCCKQVNPMENLHEHFTMDNEEEDDEEEDFSSDSEEDKAVERACQKLLPKVKEVVDKVCGSAKPSLSGNVELACLVCSAMQSFKGWKALVAHAQSFRKKKVIQHRGYYRALDSMLKIKEDLGQGKEEEAPSAGCASLIETSLSESHIIVWPPVVVIERIDPSSHSSESNAISKGNWITQGEGTIEDMEIQTVLSQELQGLHPKDIITCGRNQSVILFEASSLGYMEAKAMNDRLRETKHGRKDWLHFMNYRHSSLSKECHGITGWLFGYLAEPADLKLIDPNKTIVKDWSEESYKEKVQAANKRMKQEHENKQAKLKAMEWKVVTLSKEEKINKCHKQMMSQKIQIRDKEIKEQQNRIHEMRRYFDYEYRKLFKEFGERLQNLDQQFSTTVNKLEEELQRDDKSYERERNSREKQIQSRHLTLEKLKEGYEKCVEEKALDREAKLIVRRKNFMEEVRKAEADINAKIQLVESSLQREQQEEMAKLVEENEREREAFYKDWIKENETMKKQVEELRKNKEQVKQNDKLEDNHQEEKTSECMICWEDLIPENRALLAPCGHTQLCIGCAQHIFLESKVCPMCRQKITKKPIRCPKSLLGPS